MNKQKAPNLLVIILILLNASNFLNAIQPTDNTEIIIIGTVHESTASYNSDTLLNIFNKIKPDVILVESDTSYMTHDFKLKDDIEFMFPETIAITEYSKEHKITLRPYDISGRDVFLDNESRLSNLSGFFNDFYSLKENGKLGAQSQAMFDKIESTTELAGEMSNACASYINGSEGSPKIDSINYYTYEGLKILAEETPELSKYEDFWNEEYEFWNKRNDTMVRNILRFKKQFEGKRIIVLCGFAHKNVLKRKLQEQAGEGSDVKEFFEY